MKLSDLVSRIYVFICRCARRYQQLKTIVLYKPIAKKIGRRTIIRKQNILTGLRYMELGENVDIYANSRIQILDRYGDDKYEPVFCVGDNTEIHQNCHITCAGRIEIGKNVRIVSNVTITDIIHPHHDTSGPIYNQPLIVGEVSIGDETYIYNNAVILPNVKIGKHCVIGANSVVNIDISDYSVAAGNPAKILSKYNPHTKQWDRVR